MTFVDILLFLLLTLLFSAPIAAVWLYAKGEILWQGHYRGKLVQLFFRKGKEMVEVHFDGKKIFEEDMLSNSVFGSFLYQEMIFSDPEIGQSQLGLIIDETGL